METIAGVTPQWVIYPTAWKTWVWDKEVCESATAYILEHVPQVKDEIKYAASKESKHNRARAWRMVADEVGHYLTRRTGERIDLGKLAAHSWTAVAAMPHRIAMRLSQHLPY